MEIVVLSDAVECIRIIRAYQKRFGYIIGGARERIGFYLVSLIDTLEVFGYPRGLLEGSNGIGKGIHVRCHWNIGSVDVEYNVY